MAAARQCRLILTVAAVAATAMPSRAEEAAVAMFVVERDRIVAPLAGKSGDAARGRAIVLDRETGNCLICHRVPEPAERFQGELGPDLGGVGARLSAAEIRLRLVDQSRLNPATVMPPYYRIDGLTRVAARWLGRPVLDAQQIEDVVAYLARLQQ